MESSVNQIAHQTDFWTLASQEDKIKALWSISGLPSRRAENEQVDKALYHLALDGVTRYGLAEAVKAVAQNKLGHPFFPEPQELRGLCDKAMEWPERQRERQIRQDRYLQERRENNAVVQRSPEAIARQQAAYRRFLSGYEVEKNDAEEAERAEIRARYGLTDEAVSALPDQPLPSNFKRVA